MESFIISNLGTIKNENMKIFHSEKCEILYEGLIYSYNKKSGIETIQWLSHVYENENTIPFNDLHGAFTCIIRKGNIITIFTDNSNMHCLYYSDNYCSNKFLQIVNYEKNKNTFNKNALCEYITLGNIYQNQTFFDNIKILDNKYYITFIDEKRNIVEKNIGDISADSKLKTINSFFEKFAFSISELNVSQSLTGGYDSRLIYASMSSKINEHIAISTNNLKHKDVKYANKVAKSNKDELDIITIKKPVFYNDLIGKIIIESDGMMPLDIDSYLRLRQFKEELSHRYNILLTGDGGVLHKDWEWLQDFPFYKKKKSDAKKFYYQRLFYINNSNHIGSLLQDSLANQEKRIISYLNEYKKKYNTQSYDFWYYYISGNRRCYYNSNSINSLICYAPLMELDIVRYSYLLPRWKRFFYNSMREATTKENKKIARCKTNYGTTASNEIIYLFRDFFFQLFDYFVKFCRLFGRKIFKKTLFVKPVIDWSLENEIRKSSNTSDALKYAIKNGFLKQNLSINDLSYSELQRVIHIFYLSKFV